MFHFNVQFNNFLTWYSFILEKTRWQLVIGPDKLVLLVATLPDLLNPCPKWTSTIRYKSHCPRWTISSAISRRSPTSKFRHALIHFWRSCKVGKYSANHLFQKISVRCCTCLQRFCDFYNTNLPSRIRLVENLDFTVEEFKAGDSGSKVLNLQGCHC